MNQTLLFVEVGRDRRRDMEDRATVYRAYRAVRARRSRDGGRRRVAQTRIAQWARASVPV